MVSFYLELSNRELCSLSDQFSLIEKLMKKTLRHSHGHLQQWFFTSVFSVAKSNIGISHSNRDNTGILSNSKLNYNCNTFLQKLVIPKLQDIVIYSPQKSLWYIHVHTLLIKKDISNINYHCCYIFLILWNFFMGNLTVFAGFSWDSESLDKKKKSSKNYCYHESI